MTLNATASALAAEIAAHDWTDSPFRIDRAGHQRSTDSPSNLTEHVLSDVEAGFVRTNVMWVTGQVMAHQDPHFDVNAYAENCGVPDRVRLRKDGTPSGTIDAGLRFHQTPNGRVYAMPGSGVGSNVRVAMNSYGQDAAVCGEVKLHTDNGGFSHNLACLRPGAFAVTTFNGTAYGEGYIRSLDKRGDWYVVVWDSFWAVANPYQCTARGGRHYVDILI